jgi:hypothetical protein
VRRPDRAICQPLDDLGSVALMRYGLVQHQAGQFDVREILVLGDRLGQLFGGGSLRRSAAVHYALEVPFVADHVQFFALIRKRHQKSAAYFRWLSE